MIDQLGARIERLKYGFDRRSVVAAAIAASLTAVAPAGEAKKKKKKKNKNKPCPRNTSRCGKSCIDTRTDGQNCGTCGNSCSAETTCCAGECVDQQQDERHCGACGTECGMWQACCEGTCTDRWSSNGGLGGRLPYGVWVSPNGDAAWITELWDGRVAVYRKGATRWERETTFGTPGSSESQLEYPEGLCASSDGTKVWIADTLNHRVSIWGLDNGAWVPQETFGSRGEGPEHLAQPEDVVVSQDGKTAWVADSLNSRISVWTEEQGSWTPQTTFGAPGSGPAQLRGPSGLAVSDDGATVWVADRLNHRIAIWTKSGGVWAPEDHFGNEGGGPRQFNYPSAVAVAKDGKTAWVADSLNNRVVVWEQRTGVWSPYYTVGNAAAPAQQDPRDVAVTADGKALWIAEPDRPSVTSWLETGCSR